MVLWLRLPVLDVLAMGLPGSCRPRSACALPRATQHELQNDLQMVTTYDGPRGACEGPRWEPRPAAASAGLGAA